MNMSYCRFENTRKDLNDCLSVLKGEYENNSISSNEKRHAKKMLKEVAEFIIENNLIDEDGNFNEDSCNYLLSEIEE